MKRMMQNLNKLKREEEGVVAIVIAIAMVVLLGMTSLVVDVGLTYYQRSRLQTAADAAALAGAAFLPDRAQAETKARAYLEANGFSSDTEHCEISFPNNSQITVTPTASNKTVFGSIFGVEQQDNTCPATAEHMDKESSETAAFTCEFGYVLFSGSSTTKLDLGGGYVIDGGVHTNNSATIGGSTGTCKAADGTYKRCGVYGNTSACGTVSSVNNQVYGNRVSSAPYVEMPDFDGIIMADHPEWKPFDRSVMGAAPPSVISASSAGTNKNPTVVNGPVTINGAFNKSWGENTLNGTTFVYGNFTSGGTVKCTGSLFVDGDFTTNYGTLYIGGDLYVTGKLNIGGTSLIVGGSIYCEKDFVLGGSDSLRIGDSIYCAGNLTLNSSNGSGHNIPGDVYCNGVTKMYGTTDVWGDIYSTGNLTFTGNFPSVTTHGGYIYTKSTFRSEQGFNTEGVFVAEGNVEVYGMPSTLNGTVALYSRHGNIVFSPGNGMKAYGMVYAPEGKITFGSGGMEFHGNVIGDSIACYPGGLSLDANMVDPLTGEVHTLPFEVDTPQVLVRLIY